MPYGTVVDLAVAVIIGGAFGKVVNSMVVGVLTLIAGSIRAITLDPALIAPSSV